MDHETAIEQLGRLRELDTFISRRAGPELISVCKEALGYQWVLIELIADDRRKSRKSREIRYATYVHGWTCFVVAVLGLERSFLNRSHLHQICFATSHRPIALGKVALRTLKEGVHVRSQSLPRPYCHS